LLAQQALQDLPLLPDEKEYLLHIPDLILKPSEAFRDVLPA
jgi:hypothetical protein